jgi:hypothetical protein
MNFHVKILNFQSLCFSQFRCEIQVFFIRFHEFSWNNIELSKFTFFPVQMWDSSLFHALSWIFMIKYPTFKVDSFRCEIQVFFMSFYKLSWKKIDSLFSQFRCEIQVFFMRFHEFSRKNIELSKFMFFPVQMWDLSLFHPLSWIFMKQYRTFKVHSFPSSDVRFKSISCAFMNFHVEISNFESSLFSQFRCEIQVYFMRFHEFSCKNIEFSKLPLFLVQIWDLSLFHALSWIFM